MGYVDEQTYCPIEYSINWGAVATLLVKTETVHVRCVYERNNGAMLAIYD
jgi:hypothetical protein